MSVYMVTVSDCQKPTIAVASGISHDPHAIQVCIS